MWLLCPNLSTGRGCIPDSVGHIGENGDQPALTIKFISETSANTAQQSGQQVVITGAKLPVLQVVLQKPDTKIVSSHNRAVSTETSLSINPADQKR